MRHPKSDHSRGGSRLSGHAECAGLARQCDKTCRARFIGETERFGEPQAHVEAGDTLDLLGVEHWKGTQRHEAQPYGAPDAARAWCGRQIACRHSGAPPDRYIPGCTSCISGHRLSACPKRSKGTRGGSHPNPRMGTPTSKTGSDASCRTSSRSCGSWTNPFGRRSPALTMRSSTGGRSTACPRWGGSSRSRPTTFPSTSCSSVAATSTLRLRSATPARPATSRSRPWPRLRSPK